MRLKMILIVLLGLACWIAGQSWSLWFQPELTTDVALEQMERNEEAAQLMRTAGEAQQWVTLALWGVFLAGSMLILSWDGSHWLVERFVDPIRKEEER